MTAAPVDEAELEVDNADEPVAPTVECDETDPVQTRSGRRVNWGRLFGFVVLPLIALILGTGAGLLRWQDSSARDAQSAAGESVAAARDSTIALLSYQPSTADKDLVAARDRLTGSFREAYTKLTNDVVIPGAKEQQISAVAAVPAAASVAASESRAVVLLFVNQTVIVADGAPTNSASSVRVTLDKVGDRWLISGFEPI